MAVSCCFSTVHPGKQINRLPRDNKKTQTTQQASQTHRKQELLDLLHGVCHTQVGLGHGGKHLDEYMQLHGQVCVLGLAAFPQPLLLEQGHMSYPRVRDSTQLTLKLNELCKK